MSLLDTVAGLRKMEAEASTGPFVAVEERGEPEEFDLYPINVLGTLSDVVENTEYTIELLNAAPALLQVLRLIQPGDADALDVMATYFELPREGAPASNEIGKHWASVLRRLQEAARLMEADQ